MMIIALEEKFEFPFLPGKMDMVLRKDPAEIKSGGYHALLHASQRNS